MIVNKKMNIVVMLPINFVKIQFSVISNETSQLCTEDACQCCIKLNDYM